MAEEQLVLPLLMPHLNAPAITPPFLASDATGATLSTNTILLILISMGNHEALERSRLKFFKRNYFSVPVAECTKCAGKQRGGGSFTPVPVWRRVRDKGGVLIELQR